MSKASVWVHITHYGLSFNHLKRQCLSSHRYLAELFHSIIAVLSVCDWILITKIYILFYQICCILDPIQMFLCILFSIKFLCKSMLTYCQLRPKENKSWDLFQNAMIFVSIWHLEMSVKTMFVQSCTCWYILFIKYVLCTEICTLSISMWNITTYSVIYYYNQTNGSNLNLSPALCLFVNEVTRIVILLRCSSGVRHLYSRSAIVWCWGLDSLWFWLTTTLNHLISLHLITIYLY